MAFPIPCVAPVIIAVGIKRWLPYFPAKIQLMWRAFPTFLVRMYGFIFTLALTLSL
jgi:hypothetical protein